MNEIELIEIDLESLGKDQKSVVLAFCHIIAAQRETQMALANIVYIQQESSCYADAASTIREVLRSLVDVENNLRSEIESIAIDRGANPGDVVRFFNKEGKTVAAIQIKEVCDE